MKRRVAFCTLGCKVNQSEAEGMKSLLESAGYEVVDFTDEADVYVIHSCTVTHLSDRKSRQAIRRAIRQNPKAIVVVSGCYAQVAPDDILAIPGVDIVLGTQDRGRIGELIEEVARTGRRIKAVRKFGKGKEFEELKATAVSRTRAFVKIEEGCEEFCTYCIVPYARGPVRSRLPENILSEIEDLVTRGFREVVITGVHIGAYGRDLGGDLNLDFLLRKIVRIEGLARLRLSSIDPHEFTPELISTIVGSEVICPHLHIPLQHGDDYILELMGRKYTSRQYRELVELLRKSRPGIAITTDVMVGFPQETEERFRRSYRFIEGLGLSNIHVFRYSPRAKTPAARMPGQVPAEVKKERAAKMMDLAKKMAGEYARSFLG
ncbi:MAG: tRNA (N(6)-L-threonylcarbamoyladenosine(37)-C(2))-methylthiotransferase MtaB, partial [Clostridia bacterium]|nr:tRNA (N(6)-L-threonylcarbamoyladenosine(37)-C(2))-methylthiotransferase MtaB [Clostridia bacterium]